MDLRLADKSEWVKVFDPRDCTIFVPSDAPPAIGTQARVDITLGEGGPKIILRGETISRRDRPDGPTEAGCSVALGREEREKINYINGFVRGGLLDLRERRRLPLRLEVTYSSGVDEPCKSYTRDINEEGVFVVSERPLPENSEVHLVVQLPARAEPVSLTGQVSHTVVIEDEDLPGMGIVFKKEFRTPAFNALIDELEQAFLSGGLPDEVLQ
jgi:Tfp pilus assembly protein PilZ